MGLWKVWIVLAVLPVLCLGQIPNRYRLPRTTKPTHYDLDLRIDVDEGKFSGKVEISVLVIEATNSIVLHYKDMVITEMKLHHLQTEILVSDHSYSTMFEMLTLDFLEPLTVGQTYLLSLEFNSDIRTDLKGLYISTYFDADGLKKRIATTFMAPNYARMAFPCYDEPEHKANYTIHIVHAKKYFALSNMPADNEEDQDDGWTRTNFKESQPTSTYIVAFIVSDFVNTADPETNFKIYTQPARANDTAYAMKYAQTALKHMETYVDRQFQYPKLDMIAIDDFLMGAMENWGLITYLSSRMLVNPKTDVKSLIALSKTMSHELAHQWFGNEVSHYYWYCVWLKEGLATLFEDIITGEINPNWRMMDQFVVNTVQFVMQQDAVKNTRTMMKIYDSPDEIRRVYDYVTYKKAGSVMRMMQHIMTPEIFRRAMHFYIEKNSFNVATPESLVQAWQMAIDEAGNPNGLPTMDIVFNSWINTPGFPVVKVDRNYESGMVTVSQRRFISISEESSLQTAKFMVPLNYATEKDPNFSDTKPIDFISTTDFEKSYRIDANSSQWIVFNKQVTGYYRVNYDDDNWRLLSSALKSVNKTIVPANRAQLYDDALNLARYDLLDYRIALDLATSLRNETDFIPILSALNNLRELERSGRGTGLDLEGYLVSLVDGLYEKYPLVEVPSESETEKVLRMEVVTFACRYGHSKCASDAFYLLLKAAPDNSDLPANFQSAIFCGALKYRGEDAGWNLAFDMIMARLGVASTIEAWRRKNDKEVNDIFESFSCLDDGDFQGIILDYSLDFTGIYFDKGDYNKLFSAIASGNEDGTLRALRFLQRHYAAIAQKYESMAKVYDVLAKNVVNEEMSQLFYAILSDNYDSTNASFELETAVANARELVPENMRWRAKSLESIRLYLKEYRGSAVHLMLQKTILILVFAVGWRNLF